MDEYYKKTIKKKNDCNFAISRLDNFFMLRNYLEHFPHRVWCMTNFFIFAIKNAMDMVCCEENSRVTSNESVKGNMREVNN